MFNKNIFYYYLFFLILHVNAKNSDELMQKFVQMLIECGKDYPMTGDDIEQLKNKQLPDKENIRCLFACAYKASGMMDDQGKLSVVGVNDYALEYLADDAEKLSKARDFTEACKSVNDVEVSDGGKGCDRAALIFKCSVDKASQFGFGI